MKYISNPSLYERLSKPVSSVEEAERKMQEFHEDLRDLREKHGIPDIAIAMGVYVEHPGDGKGKFFVSSSNMGNIKLAPELFALGYEQYMAAMNEKIEVVSEGEFREQKEARKKPEDHEKCEECGHLGCCPQCGSGDMRWCSISVRPYCNECTYWAPINHGSERSALLRLKERQLEAEVEPTNKVYS